MQIGKYIPLNSNFHKMNPIIKLICLIVFIVALFFSYDIKINLLLTIFVIIVMLNTLIPISFYLKIIYKMRWFLLFLIVINIIFDVCNYTILITVLRIIYIVIYSNIFLMTTTLNDITYSLKVLFSPLKIIGVKVNRMALSISLALNFIPNLYEQSNKILKSQASRGIDYKSGFKNKIISLTSLIFPLFNLSLRSSDELANIMYVRLYDIDKNKTRFKENTVTIFDIIMICVHILILLLIIVKEVFV